MRPIRSTEAHQTSDFAELVCSNSLKSESENTAPWLLKQEMRRAGSLPPRRTPTPPPSPPATPSPSTASSSPRRVAARIAAEPRITVHREEVTHLDENDADTITILATGPLTSPALAAELQRLTGADHLAFYDSISPIVDASTIDMDKVYFAARWDKGTADYINCPFTKEEYDALPRRPHHRRKGRRQSLGTIPECPTRVPRLTDRTSSAATTTTNQQPLLHYFEGCLPIEETARRGRDTLRFGPMKPAGLTNPKTGRWPYAAVQLRQENLRADSYNLVGFQNHLKFGEQARVLRLIPGLENATFLRYGQIHRNTYIHAPSLLTETLQLTPHPNILIAGQLSGVEGYTESIASGLLAGRYAAALAHGQQPDARPPPHRQRLAHPLHHPRRDQTLPARQHHLRPAAAARRRAPQEDPRQKRTPPHPMRARPRSLGRLANSNPPARRRPRLN